MCTAVYRKRCARFMRWGDKAVKGCKEISCPNLHPSVCPASLNLLCTDQSCIHKVHVYKCKRRKTGSSEKPKQTARVIGSSKDQSVKAKKHVKKSPKMAFQVAVQVAVQVASPVIRPVAVLLPNVMLPQPVIFALQQAVRVLLPVMSIAVGMLVAVMQDSLSLSIFRPSLRLWVFRLRQSSLCWKPGWRV